MKRSIAVAVVVALGLILLSAPAVRAQGSISCGDSIASSGALKKLSDARVPLRA